MDLTKSTVQCMTGRLDLNMASTVQAAAQPVAHTNASIRALLNDGLFDDLETLLKDAGSIELDLTEPDLSEADLKIGVDKTTLGLSGQGVSTLITLLTKSEVRLTKLVLGYVHAFEPIMDCLKYASKLERFDISNMTVLDPSDRTSHKGKEGPMNSLAIFIGCLHRGSTFRELRVNANIDLNAYKWLVEVQLQLAWDDLSTGDCERDKGVKFVDPKHTIAPAKIPVTSEKEACHYLLHLLNNGNTEGFKAAYKHGSCAVTVLDLPTHPMLETRGAYALALVLCDHTIRLKKVIIHLAVTLEPILSALPYTKLQVLDLSELTISTTMRGGWIRESTLTDDELQILGELSVSGETVTTRILLNSRSLLDVQRETLNKAKRSTLPITDVFEPTPNEKALQGLVKDLNRGRMPLNADTCLTIPELDLSGDQLLLTGKGVSQLVATCRAHKIKSLKLGRMESFDAFKRLEPHHFPEMLDLSKARTVAARSHDSCGFQGNYLWRESLLCDYQISALTTRIKNAKDGQVTLQRLCIDTTGMHEDAVNELVADCAEAGVTLQDVRPSNEQMRRTEKGMKILSALNVGMASTVIHSLDSENNVLDLSLGGELKVNGAIALGEVLSNRALPLNKVIMGSVDTLKPILLALPGSNLRELDLTSVSITQSASGTASLSNELVDSLLNLVRYVDLLKVVIRLDSKSLSDRDRTKLHKAYLSGMPIIDVAVPALSAEQRSAVIDTLNRGGPVGTDVSTPVLNLFDPLSQLKEQSVTSLANSMERGYVTSLAPGRVANLAPLTKMDASWLPTELDLSTTAICFEYEGKPMDRPINDVEINALAKQMERSSHHALRGFRLRVLRIDSHAVSKQVLGRLKAACAARRVTLVEV